MRARQKVSRAGVELIKSFEGLRTTAARLPDGRWTLGYGHTFSAREGARVTQEDADALLRFDLLPVVDAINNLVLVPLNQNQFDALVSFCFNIGAENFAQSTVLKRINEGRYAEAALAMDSWRSAEFNGQTYVLAPLIRRRAAEKDLFLTPEEVSHQAATLGRPVEDVRPSAAAPEASYINPYASPAPAAAERQVIDLGTSAPSETVVESLPQGFTGTPVPPAAPEPRTSIDIQAAIARAQDEHRRLEEAQRAEALRAEAQRIEAERIEAQKLETQRLEMQREAEALAAAEAARLQEQQRLEAARIEQARIEQARLEQARVEQERLEQWRLEQARIEAEQAEAARLASIRAEAVRQEQIRLEQVRLEQARIEAERLERERLETERLEAERLENERQEEIRQAQARLEAERQAVERAQAEQARLEQARLEQARLEQARLEQEKRDREAAAAQSAPPADDEAEMARKAEAAAALMRLYSPYGGGNLGRPLAGPFPKPAPDPQYAPQAAPQPAPVVTPTVQPGPEFTNHSLISPSTAESAPFEISSRAEAVSETPEPEVAPAVVDFSPTGSASTMPPPVITALNPYARPIPAAAPVIAAATETLVEVPRPAPVDLSAPSNAPIAAEMAGLHWREQLQRPLPQDYQAPQATPQRTEPEQPFLRAGPSSNFQTAAYEDDSESWMMNGDRIALSAEEADEPHETLWQMIMKTLWLITISGIGLGCLGAATGAWWQATHDQTVIRNGMVDTYTFISIGTAALGILFVSISVWLILKRLGGLKD
ncbi:lysozyme [Asticcacaulis taihuensis]|uniref:Lysozyme n=1 Tax=Asticcacaulis taihuensis TaxID=260084 RepID=A0A1G4TH47_9CAUL|nr:lysozyme [Asticcacaulis taihuensis]SCW80793.1 Phage-related lysozyme (muramidase), GH24 family [Asticcacaulis taihuensis]